AGVTGAGEQAAAQLAANIARAMALRPRRVHGLAITPWSPCVGVMDGGGPATGVPRPIVARLTAASVVSGLTLRGPTVPDGGAPGRGARSPGDTTGRRPTFAVCAAEQHPGPPGAGWLESARRPSLGRGEQEWEKD